jgi:hypothetical protein
VVVVHGVLVVAVDEGAVKGVEVEVHGRPVEAHGRSIDVDHTGNPQAVVFHN